MAYSVPPYRVSFLFPQKKPIRRIDRLGIISGVSEGSVAASRSLGGLNQKPGIKTMPGKGVKREAAMKFLEELSATLDMDAAMRRAGISAEEAKGILKALIPHGESPVAHAPGKEAGHRPAGSCDVYVDGASRGNPGRAGAGAMIVGPGGEVLKRLRRYLGVTTNNVAEYEALIMALEEASSLGCRRIKAYADSELMVRQLNGEYAVRSEVLKPLFGKVLKLIRSFEAFSISHVYREKNKDADTLANEAIDSGTG